MCGIAGIVRFDDVPVEPDLVRQMTATLLHRGPDEIGFWSAPGDSPRAVFGHTRLSIIDLAGSPQPMSTPDGRYTLVFNGEILNYRELRAELNYPFTTNGDTEVLLAGLSIGGAAFVTRLRGQYAFALRDNRDGSLLLCRDRLGILPLVYLLMDSAVAFASEPKALLPAIPGGPSVDTVSLDAYLAYGSVPAPFTLFEGVRKLPPAHTLTIDARGNTRLSRYWEPPSPDPRGLWDDASAVAAVAAGIRSGVSAALVADVQVGSYLSGGLDSSLIVAMMRSLAPDAAILTFSAGFGDLRYDETPYARSVAQWARTEHFQVDVRPDDFEELWPALTWYRDAPLSQPADIAVFRLAQLARRHVKVVLSGEGSDELFAGYPKYSMARFSGIGGRLHLDPLTPGIDRVLRRRWHRARIAARSALASDREEALRAWFAPFVDSERRELLGTGAPRPLPAFPDRGGTMVQQLLRHDLQTWLPDNLLERGDRMSMAASLELRPPFLDGDLVDVAFRLPDRMKVRRGERKWVVKQVASDYLPDRIIRRPKVGFKVPLDAWFKDGLNTMSGDLLLAPGSFVSQVLDRRRTAEVLRRHTDGIANEERALWTLVGLEIWHRTFFGPSGSAGAPALPSHD